MSKKTSREIALERRKAMSDSGKKAAAYSSTTKDRVRSSQDIQISGTQSSPNNQNISKPATKHIPKTQVNRMSSPTNLSSKELVIVVKKMMLILQLLNIEFYLLNIYRFLVISLLQIIKILLNQLQNISQKPR